MMLVSTRMSSAKRCRRLLMLSILFITTASLATPAACASEALKAACLSLVKSDFDIGRDSVIRTSCVLVEADVVVPEVVGGVQSVISSLPDCDVFPAGHWVQVLSDKAPVDAENVPGGHFVQSKAAPIVGEYVPTGHGCLSLAPPGQ